MHINMIQLVCMIKAKSEVYSYISCNMLWYYYSRMCICPCVLFCVADRMKRPERRARKYYILKVLLGKHQVSSLWEIKFPFLFFLLCLCGYIFDFFQSLARVAQNYILYYCCYYILASRRPIYIYLYIIYIHIDMCGRFASPKIQIFESS